MTETTATVAAETPVRLPRRALAGIVSNIDRTVVGNMPVVLASLLTTYQGKENVYSLMISGAVIDTVNDLLVEGAPARFYGEIGCEYVTVLGPDLTKRTLTREALKVEKAAAPAKTAAPKAKRVMSDKQREAWNSIILPSLMAGRARKAAERAAAQGTQGEEVAA